MKLTITLNASPNMATKEDFATMLRTLADQLERAPGILNAPVYDNNRVRVGTFILSEAHNVAPRFH